MYFIAVAYAELNKAEPDCGTTFTWAARAFGTRTGWMGGWGIIIADVIVMANLSQIAGSYSFSLVGADRLAASTFWSTVAGIVWIVVMTYICYRGHRGVGPPAVRPARRRGGHAGRLRALRPRRRCTPASAPAGIKPVLSLALAVRAARGTSIVTATPDRGVHLLGLGHRGRHQRGVGRPGHHPRPGRDHLDRAAAADLRRWSRWPRSPSPASATKGIGLGNVDNADDVFAAMGHEVFGGGAVGWIMVHLLAICVLTSASASTQTTILPTARTTLSMAAFKAIPERFARIHPTLPHPDRLDPLDGRGLDHLLRRADADQREHPGRHDRRGRPDDRLLLRSHRLRVRVVLPQDHVVKRTATC